MAYYAKGGASYFLAKSLSTRHLYLFGGDQGPSLLAHGLTCDGGQIFEDIGSMFAALRPLAARKLSLDTALRPSAAIFPREATEERGSRAN